ncbi:DUF3397 domain-containing protein [Salipaludibacillus daqingensis]|uniref:DUF3397 domain-containing protein n=1 Tax=Salipaludibacillus daqingensis TaxID=3041001 RepID=UPI0024742680|nr:DUF3397 domain-containing protein [Salipaludibacillus daqingensis]
MYEITAIIIATFVTVPILGLYIIYLLFVKTTKNKQLSFKVAVDSTALLFIISVYYLFLEIWNIQAGWFFALFVLLSAVFFTFFHWKKHEDIDMRKVLKGVWRFQFVVFSTLYIVLLIYGLIFRIYT